MNLSYLNTKSVTQLRENIQENSHYYSRDSKWTEEYLNSIFVSEVCILESKIPYIFTELTVGNGKNESKYDAENAKKIHQSLQHLTPAQATDPRIWTYLTHDVYYEYMKRRWLNKEQIAYGTLTRFFASTNRELIRNGIARLWWYGYLTYDKKRKNPYELTELLLSNQDIAQGLLERKLGNNKEWLITMLDCILSYKTEYPDIVKSSTITKIVKELNYAGSVSLLDLLTPNETKQFLQETINQLQKDTTGV